MGKVQRKQLMKAFSASPSQSTNVRAPATIQHTLELEVELLKLWRRLLGSESVTMDDSFFESGGDSFLAMEMVFEVERLVGHPVPITVMFEADTIRQLAPRIIAQSRACARSSGDGNWPPLFLFHGDFNGGGLEFRHFVSLLGSYQSIVLIDPHGMRGEPILPSIEEMAADRLPLILERQPSGPFLLGGKCNGGLVAFEAARLLMAAGHKVGMVAMIDPPTVCARPVMRMILKLMRDVVSPRRLAWMHKRMALLEQFPHMSPAQILARTGGFAYRRLARLPRYHERHEAEARYESYTIAMARYSPAPLDVPVAFYAATHHGRAWQRICPNLEIIKIPGDHYDCLTVGAEPLVMHLRQRIGSCFGGTVHTGLMKSPGQTHDRSLGGDLI